MPAAKRLFIVFCLLLTPIFLGIRTAHADVGEMPEPGGVISPGDKNDSISMLSEKVNFDVKPGAKELFETAYNGYYAHVTAHFVMQNIMEKDILTQVFFPFHFTNDLQYFDENDSLNQAKNIRVSVNTVPTEITFQTLPVQSLEEGQNEVVAGVFQTQFPAEAQTNIDIEYDLRAVNEPKSEVVSFDYLMETGSHWAGEIGSGEIDFNFWQPLSNKIALNQVNDFFTIDNGSLVWKFKNLEPAANHNIKVSFIPEQIEAWAKRPDYLKNMQASEVNKTGIYHSYGTRTGEQYPGGYLDVSPVNIIDRDSDRRGWLTEVTDPLDAWIELDFNANYTVGKVKFRTGILDTEWSSDEEQVYDTYQRPKTINVVYSDGTVQTVNLLNKSGETQTKDLLAKPTSSLKFVFDSAYQGTGDGNNYIGVGRIELVDVNAVHIAAPLEDNEDEATSEEELTENDDSGEQADTGEQETLDASLETPETEDVSSPDQAPEPQSSDTKQDLFELLSGPWVVIGFGLVGGLIVLGMTILSLAKANKKIEKESKQEGKKEEANKKDA